jgi:hypothetical protein
MPIDSVFLRWLAEKFPGAQPLPRPIDFESVKVDRAVSRLIADAFEAAQHQPNDPKTRKAYQALCEETKQQFLFIQEAGIRLRPWKEQGQPYPDSRAMLASLREGVLFFFLTKNGHGETEDRLDQSENPFLQPSGIELEGESLVYNDLFRPVHDVFGHGVAGSSFGPDGEEKAWMAHTHLFSSVARRAMSVETRAQANWQNSGPHMRVCGRLLEKGDDGYLPLSRRPYAAQKMTLLPEWVSEIPQI